MNIQVWIDEGEYTGTVTLRQVGPFSPRDRIVTIDAQEGDMQADLVKKAFAVYQAKGLELKYDLETLLERLEDA